MFGVLVTVGAREYLPLNFSATFYLKELRLVNNLFNERVFSSLGVTFFSILFIFYLFILPHHKYNENSKRKNIKNGFNNGEETQRKL